MTAQRKRRRRPAPRQADATDFAVLAMRGWVLAAEASVVVGMRMLGLAGLWSMRPDEAQRMLTEKPGAFADAAVGATAAMMRGQRPDQIAAAALAPLTRTARANRRRLTKSALRAPQRNP